MPRQQGGFPRPFAESYPVALTVAIVALTPFIVVSTAYALYEQHVLADIGATRRASGIISALSTAGYAFGALFAGDLIQRYPQRILFFACESLFIIGSIMAGVAPGTVYYGSGRVLMGFATGLLLVVALPPVVRRFPATKLPITAAAINIGFFGAVTAGPLIGAGVASGHGWRWFYGALAGVGFANLVLSSFTLPDQPPPRPNMTFDHPGIYLGLAGTSLSFWAAGELSGIGFDSPWFIVPLAIGLASLLAMLLVEYHKEDSVAPVKPMWSTYPSSGVLVAMAGGGAYIAFLLLTLQLQMRVFGETPFEAGLRWWPQVLAVVIAALTLAVLLKTRYLPVFTLAGLLLLIGAGAMLAVMDENNHGIVLPAAAAMLGLGAGATVSPGLWITAFSLPSQMVGRTFALVELVRSEADYILAPVMMQVAQVASGGFALNLAGIHDAIWITLLITISATLAVVLIYLLGSLRLPVPDLEGWISQGKTAFRSPPFGSSIRGGGDTSNGGSE